jgi:hypothetical protein
MVQTAKRVPKVNRGTHSKQIAFQNEDGAIQRQPLQDTGRPQY